MVENVAAAPDRMIDIFFFLTWIVVVIWFIGDIVMSQSVKFVRLFLFLLASVLFFLHPFV